MKLHLGCGRTLLEGWVNVDCVPAEGVTVCDLNDCRRTPLPFADDSVDEIFASHLIEHITDTLPLMQELHRVAKNGSHAIFRLPYGSSDEAWEDPTHVRPYFIQSFQYFSQPAYWRADYGYRGDWRIDRLVLCIEKGVQEKYAADLGNAIMRERNVVQEQVVELTAIKPIRQPLRELQSMPEIKVELIGK